MKIIVVNEKMFNKKKILNKKVEFIVLFNKNLFDSLQKFNVVLIDKRGKIRKSNYFPNRIYKLKSTNAIIEFKKNIFKYFEKKYINLYRKKIGYIHRTNMLINTYIAYAKKQKNTNDLINVLDNAIFEIILQYFSVKYSADYVKKYKKYFEISFNYITSLYRSYVYSNKDLKRGAEIFNDIFRFIVFFELWKKFRPNDADITIFGFKNMYFKVISRFFIEEIHKQPDIRVFAEKNILLWQSNGWIE